MVQKKHVGDVMFRTLCFVAFVFVTGDLFGADIGGLSTAMEANDAQFSRMRLEYKRVSTLRMPGSPRMSEGVLSEHLERVKNGEYRSVNFTEFWAFDGDFVEKQRRTRTAKHPHLFKSKVGRRRRDVWPNGPNDENAPTRDWIVDERDADPSRSGYSGEVLLLKFALGIGLGGKFREARVAPASDGGYEIDGLVSIWGNDRSQCRLSVDSNLIVRKAKIVGKVGEREVCTFEFETSGTFANNGFACARRGKLKRAPRDFTVELFSANPKITRQQFDKLIGYKPPSNVTIHNVGRAPQAMVQSK